MIIEINGFPVGSKSGAIFSEKTEQRAIPKFADPLPSADNIDTGVAMWGDNNLLPQEMADDIENTPILGAAVDGKARIAMGTGPVLMKRAGIDKNGVEILELPKIDNLNEVKDFLELNNSFMNGFATAKDLFGWGNSFTEMILTRNRQKIVGYKRHDICECRLSQKDKATRRSEFVHLSGDWSRYNRYSKESEHTDRVPLLDLDYPLMDLQSRKSGCNFMVGIQYPLFGRQYYAPSPWFSAKKWVNIVRNIPAMKEAMFKNQMTIKYVIEVHHLIWKEINPKFDSLPDDEQKKIKRDYYKSIDDNLVGGDKAYKSIFTTKLFDNKKMEWVPSVTITTIDDKVKEGKLLPDSAAGNSEILFALMMNPAILNANMPGGYEGGSGSGSDIREAFLVQVILQEMERGLVSKPFEIAKRYNGWDRDLVLRYPNRLLTTTDTGANTEGTP